MLNAMTNTRAAYRALVLAERRANAERPAAINDETIELMFYQNKARPHASSNDTRKAATWCLNDAAMHRRAYAAKRATMVALHGEDRTRWVSESKRAEVLRHLSECRDNLFDARELRKSPWVHCRPTMQYLPN